MKTIAVIINGIHMPYNVIHHAIEKAKADSSEIFALFLRGKHEPSKGYLFPSDITTNTWASGKKAESDDEKMMEDNMILVKEMIEYEKIPYRSTLKINASVKEIAKEISTADLIVVGENFDTPSILKDDKITLKALVHKILIPVDRVP
jgi:hypothetical protein